MVEDVLMMAGDGKAGVEFEVHLSGYWVRLVLPPRGLYTLQPVKTVGIST